MVDIFLRELSMYCQSVGPFRTRGMGVHAVTHAHARNAALCSGTRTNKQTSRVEPRCARRFLRTCRPAQPSARSHLPGTPTSAPRRAPPARLPRQQRRAPIAAAANVAEAEASRGRACLRLTRRIRRLRPRAGASGRCAVVAVVVAFDFIERSGPWAIAEGGRGNRLGGPIRLEPFAAKDRSDPW